MKKRIRNILKKNKNIHLAYRTYKNRKEPGYLEWVNKFRNPDVIEFNHYGEKNKEKIIYVINYDDELLGFFALWKLTLERIDYAEKYNFVPIVIWGKNSSYWDPALKDNVFENYFMPITDVDTSAIAESANVVLSRGWIDRTGNFPAEYYFFSEGGLDRYIELHRKYIRVRPDIDSKITEEISQLIGTKLTLAVHIRGVEWGNIKDHPIPIEAGVYVKLINEAISKYGFQQIFLATDSDDSLSEMIKHFGDKVVYFKDVARAVSGSRTLAIFDNKRPKDKLHGFKMGYEVLRDMMTLSYCDGLIAGYSNISVAANVWKMAAGKEYAYMHIIKNKIQTKGIDTTNAVKKMKKGNY